ncbi:hypothetical protein ACJJTC_004687 [Scirpophaga incertulas]
MSGSTTGETSDTAVLEWRQKIESWLRANSQEEQRDAELRERARRLQAHRRSLEHDSGQSPPPPGHSSSTSLSACLRPGQEEQRDAELLQAHRRSLEHDSGQSPPPPGHSSSTSLSACLRPGQEEQRDAELLQAHRRSLEHDSGQSPPPPGHSSSTSLSACLRPGQEEQRDAELLQAHRRSLEHDSGQSPPPPGHSSSTSLSACLRPGQEEQRDAELLQAHRRSLEHDSGQSPPPPGHSSSTSLSACLRPGQEEQRDAELLQAHRRSLEHDSGQSPPPPGHSSSTSLSACLRPGQEEQRDAELLQAHRRSLEHDSGQSPPPPGHSSSTSLSACLRPGQEEQRDAELLQAPPALLGTRLRSVTAAAGPLLLHLPQRMSPPRPGGAARRRAAAGPPALLGTRLRSVTAAAGPLLLHLPQRMSPPRPGGAARRRAAAGPPALLGTRLRSVTAAAAGPLLLHLPQRMSPPRPGGAARRRAAAGQSEAAGASVGAGGVAGARAGARAGAGAGAVAGAGGAEWRPARAVLPDCDLVRALEAVEDVQPRTKDRLPWRKTEENEEMRRLRRQRSRQYIEPAPPLLAISEEEKRKLPEIQVTSEQGAKLDREIDADNIETPPVQRKMFNPPPEREPCRRFQPTPKTNISDKASAEMRDLCQEILGDGQFDRFSAARRTRRYKRNPDSSSPEDEKKPEPPIELVAETQVIRPSKLDVQASYTVETPKEVAKPIDDVVKDEKEHRLKRWQDRLKSQSATTKETKPSFARMRRQTSINQEDVQKAIRELKSPTETPTGVWSRNAYRKSMSAKPDKPERTTSPRMSKVKSEHELNDEGFEETQSLNSESASQGASSGCNVECDSPVPKTTKSDPPKRISTKETRTPPRTPLDPKRSVVPKRTSSLRVERSTSRASLRSSRSSLNSSASVATVKRAPAPVKAAPKPVPKAVSRMPASRSSSSGSSVGAARPSIKTVPRTSGFMRPTQASKGRGGVTTQQVLRASVK